MDMLFRNFKYFLKEGFSNLARNRLMTIASITSVMAAMLILGLVVVIILNVNSLTYQVESQLELKAFLKDNISKEQVTQIGNDIKSIEGVTSVVFESKEEALRKFKQQLGDKSYLAEGLENDNPLPQSYIIKVKDANLMKDISNKIKQINGVEKVSYGQDVVDKLLGIIKIIRIVGLSIILILLIISIVIISNTIKLGVFARRREINIMKYIGATDWFIRWPFLIEGVILGLIGALLSVIILVLAYGYVLDVMNNKLIMFQLLPLEKIVGGILLYFSMIGAIIGALGSGLSIKRFLNV
ncbi:permease-like cell division protein FtsX [Thermoanaerobacter sp. CM-CNRG TB177]|jgi:cell division transport system permease protein|uniref:permease-like cell division protein FtsX n=1 Tax=Thermoanaerobacter sp. CM-CNRG TB177 TaxID=2800659 RepID=UPI0021081E27|nr:permease-like cell division protein FtsX [Thermoanaerobacter sp. CM-CNRG TB177]MBT1280299.1 ABC transporter permease [Thermoanaerobacter sp. CM-CNRG TB177]